MTDHLGKKKLREYYDPVVYNLSELFQKIGLLGGYIKKDMFEEDNKYFKNAIQNNLHLYNESFYFKHLFRSELPKSNIPVMYKIQKDSKK